MYKLRDEFVTIEIAKLLKELNFNCECLGHYQEGGNPNIPIRLKIGSSMFYKNMNNEEGIWLAPLWQQVFDWLLVKHDIEIHWKNFYAKVKETAVLIAINKYINGNNRNN